MVAVAKRPKPQMKWRRLRFRKNDPEHNLIVAAQQVILARGGTALVLGPVQVIHWPGDEFKYHVAVEVVGRPPKAKNPSKGGQE
jgi:hypothetical protein